MPRTPSYGILLPYLCLTLSISCWSFFWTSGLAASSCAMKLEVVETVSKPAKKKSIAWATMCSSESSMCWALGSASASSAVAKPSLFSSLAVSLLSLPLRASSRSWIRSGRAIPSDSRFWMLSLMIERKNFVTEGENIWRLMH